MNDATSIINQANKIIAQAITVTGCSGYSDFSVETASQAIIDAATAINRVATREIPSAEAELRRAVSRMAKMRAEHLVA